MAEPRILVVFYSRSGTTRKIAASLAASLGCEIEEIAPTKERSGLFGYWRSAREATQKQPASIVRAKIDPAAYDLVIVGTPVWAWSVSSPIRAYLTANKARLPDVAFFCTFGNAGAESAFAQMEAIVGQAPRAVCGFKAGTVTSGVFETRLAEFVKSLEVKGADRPRAPGSGQPAATRAIG
ncbi:MAG: flavodoxin family protein [Roseiarcus sp.]